jgi:hypothetical protein
MKIDREALHKDMQLRREEIARRQIELDNSNEIVRKDYGEILEHAKEAPQIDLYNKNGDIQDHADEPPHAGVEISDALIDIMAEVLAQTREDMRQEFRGENAALWNRITTLDAQVTTLLSLLEARKKAVRAPRETELPKPAAAPLRLAKP